MPRIAATNIDNTVPRAVPPAEYDRQTNAWVRACPLQSPE